MPRENSFTRNVETEDDGSGLVRCFAGQGRRDDLGSPILAALGTNVYGSLGECAHKRNFSVQGVESPNFRGCPRVSIAVEALLQHGPGAPEPPGEAVELGADLTSTWNQKRRGASAPSSWPKQWRLRRCTVCSPGVGRG